MAKIEVPYGKTFLHAVIPDQLPVHTVSPAQIEAADDPGSCIETALDYVTGDRQLTNFAGATSAAIAINDKTRPVPHAELLPPLLARLESIGIPSERITLLIATGTHPVMSPDEYPKILPQSIIDRYPVVCHDCMDEANLSSLGTTSRGTPVFINRQYMAADLRLVIGNVEPHQFMGFSGGVKSAAIGLAGKATINHNHAMMRDTAAALGRYDDNPARQDVEEIGRMIGIHFALNALLNGDKKIVDAIAGDPLVIMREAIPLVRKIYEVPVSRAFDLLIVSPGGYPKDINVYQSQKGLGHATPIVRPQGHIILCAACPDGTGSQSYEQWVTQPQINSHNAVFEYFAREGFRVGPHKAYQISRDASRVQVVLISDMAPDFVKQLLLEPSDSLQSALDDILSKLPSDAHIGVMPLANATIPALVESG